MSAGVAFNIASQQAGAIYQAAGDQTIEHGGGTLATSALSAVSDLRTALESTVLPGTAKRQAEHALEAVEEELAGRAPDSGRIAGQVERIIRILGRAGALVGAGEPLVGSLRSLASCAGAAGAAALRLLA